MKSVCCQLVFFDAKETSGTGRSTKAFEFLRLVDDRQEAVTDSGTSGSRALEF